MPSARRLRLLCILIVAGFITLFFTTRLGRPGARDSASLQDFYRKTATAIDRARADSAGRDGRSQVKSQVSLDKDADADIDGEDKNLARQMADRLKAAEQQAKDLANAKSPNKPDPPSNVIGVGSSAGGQLKKEDSGGISAPDARDSTETAAHDSHTEHTVDAELDVIFRKSPITLFSKTYCPYSKRAKGILLEKYVIDPPPYVVELDTHPLGPQIQARLTDMTGRKTVPNIMIVGQSIGGGDDIAELDREKLLVLKIKTLGGKRIAIKQRFDDDATAP